MTNTLDRTFAGCRPAALLGALALLGGLTLAGTASAQAWPAKPVRMIIPFPPGSAPDIIARLVSDKLSPKWGQPVVIENRPGAGGIAAMSVFVRSPADGYTLTFAPASTITLTPHLFKEPQFDVDRDIVIAATAGISPMMIVANTTSGIASLPDLIARAKASPGKVNLASASVNSVPFLTADMINRQAGVQLYVVPFNGSVQGITATLSGETVAMVDGLPPFVQHVKAGKLRAIAVTSKERLPGFESVPTAAETLPGFESIGWFAVYAPTGTPAAIVERVNRDVNDVYRMPDVVARLADLGVYPNPGSVSEAQAFLRAQRALWKKVVDDVGLKPQ